MATAFSAQQRLGVGSSSSSSSSSSAGSSSGRLAGRRAAAAGAAVAARGSSSSRRHQQQQQQQQQQQRLQQRLTSVVAAAAATEAADGGSKTVVQKVTPGEVPFPWSEKDPYRLPVSIDRVQKMLVTLGWEKPWVEQIVDRVMKGSLKTTEERASGVINYLTSLGLGQDEVCNMASISVVLLGLNPETRLKTVVDYLKKRGVADGSVADLVLRNPRIFEYKVSADGKNLEKGAARIQVDTLPSPDGKGTAVAVNYFRSNATFLSSPVSPIPPLS